MMNAFEVPRGLRELQEGRGKKVILGAGFMGDPWARLSKLAFPGAKIVVLEYDEGRVAALQKAYADGGIDIEVANTSSYAPAEGAGWIHSCVSEVPAIKEASWTSAQEVVDPDATFLSDISSGFGFPDFESYIKNMAMFGLVHGNSPFDLMPGVDAALVDRRLFPIISDLLRAMGKFTFEAERGTAALITNVVYTAVGCVYARLVQFEVATPGEIDAAWAQIGKVKLGEIMNGLNGFAIIPHMERGIRRDVDAAFRLPGVFKSVASIDGKGKFSPQGRIGWQTPTEKVEVSPKKALMIQTHLVTGLAVGIDRVLQRGICRPEVLDVANMVGISMPSVLGDVAPLVGGVEALRGMVASAILDNPQIHPGCGVPEFLQPNPRLPMPSEFPLVLREDRQVDERGVAVLTLSNPLKMNPMSSRTLEQLSRHYAEIEADPSIEAVVEVGATRHTGFQVFSSGADRKEIQANAGEPEKVGAQIDGMKTTYHGRNGLTKPVIAAVNGLAGGGGFEKALAADDIVAAVGAMFLFPEVTIGILPGADGTATLPCLVGPEDREWAMNAIRTNEPIDANTAKERGIIHEVVSLAQLIDAAARRGLEIADGKAQPRRADWDATWEMGEYKPIDTANNGMGGETPISKATDALLWAALAEIGRVKGYEPKSAAERRFFLLALRSPDCAKLMEFQIANKGEGDPGLTHQLGDIASEASEAAALFAA